MNQLETAYRAEIEAFRQARAGQDAADAWQTQTRVDTVLEHLGLEADALFEHASQGVRNFCTITGGKLTTFPGNYAAYETQKAAQLEFEATVNAKFDKLLAQEEVWIRKGVEARRTRNEGRVRRLEALRLTRAARRETLGRVKLEITSGAQSGKVIAELTDVSKAFGDKVIVKNFTATILRGDKVGLVGPNGIGKTQLALELARELGQRRARSKTKCNTPD